MDSEKRDFLDVFCSQFQYLTYWKSIFYEKENIILNVW